MNVTVRNIIDSMRQISAIDWAEIFERVSVVDEMLRARSAFASLDFQTRDSYRRRIEILARYSQSSELDITRRVLDHAAEAVDPSGGRRSWLLPIRIWRRDDQGRSPLRAPLAERIREFLTRVGSGGYIAIIGVATALILTAVLVILAKRGVGWSLPIFALLGSFPRLNSP